jgi:hypothetical protein
VEARDEQAGVDGSGDVRACDQRGDDRHVEHVGHVPSGQAALRLGDQDDPIGPIAGSGQEARQGDVARSSQDDVVLVR